MLKKKIAVLLGAATLAALIGTIALGSPASGATPTTLRHQVPLSESVQEQHPDQVLEWNQIFIDTLIATNTANSSSQRLGAIVHTAIFDAYNGIERRYTPLFIHDEAPAGASRRAAVIAAAYTALAGLFPSREPQLSERYAASLAALSDDGEDGGRSRERGIAWGTEVAQAVLAWRATDGFAGTYPAFTGGTAVGQWRPTPPLFGAMSAQGLAFTSMFVLDSNTQFRPGPPRPLTSSTYTDDFNTVKALGRKTGSSRTPDQTALALFWEFNASVHWNQAANQIARADDLSLSDSNRLLAVLNIAMADTAFTTWSAKRHYGALPTEVTWRPVTAIPLADTDGNPDTAPDADWLPLINTPSHPEYAAGHPSLNGVAATVLLSSFDDAQTFTLTATGQPSRTYSSITQARRDGNDARVWGGMHYPSTVAISDAEGEAIANYVNAGVTSKLNGRSLPATPVIDWSNEARRAIVPAGPVNIFGAENYGNKFPGEAAVYLGIVHAAIYDAAVAIEGGYEPYAIALTAPPDTSPAAAIATAAHHTLVGLQPALGLTPAQQAILDGRYADYLAAIPDGAAKSMGIAVGEQVSQAVLALRENDAREENPTLDDLDPPAPGPGVWEPNPSGPVLGLRLPGILPLGLENASQVRPDGPSALTSTEYAEDFQQVKEFGRFDSTARTPEQTTQALFWTDHDLRQWNDGMLRLAAARELDLVQTARMLAMAHVSGADAMIGCFEAKYHYWFWRPFQAIPRADTDGNPATEPDPTWQPLRPTPNFPEYPSAHACHSGAVAEALARFFGTDNVSFSLDSRVTRTTREYARFHEAVMDVNLARVLAGFHFRNSDLEGSNLGRHTAGYVAEHFFQPLG